MKIQFGISTKEIENAIKQLKDYKKWVIEKSKLLSEEFAIAGVHEASIRFETAQYDGTNDVDVYVEQTTKGYKIVAKGGAVFFIEFGAGVYHNPTEPYPEARPSGIAGIGKYGKGKGENEAWGYYGDNPGTNGVVRVNKSGKSVVITKGNPAAMPMWYASEEIRRKLSTIAREVFG